MELYVCGTAEKPNTDILAWQVNHTIQINLYMVIIFVQNSLIIVKVMLQYFSDFQVT